ncbi:MAG: FAD-dependent oxidoreductase [Deltaproteobacteria bacterium]|nr:FAD-dependent oxidoreductase [Deltaproteobacteria bacterium]
MIDASQPLALPPDDAHNRALVAQVHPPDWQNPTPAPRYNLVVIGGGTAGLVAAMGAAGLGARVALVERHLLGGDCLNFGCVPSKALLASAHMAHAASARAPELGVHASQLRVDARAVLDRLRRLRAEIAPHDGAERLRAAGVDVFLGEGRFLTPDSVGVGHATLRFARALIATGGRPVLPPVPGLRECEPRTSDTIWELTEAPARLVVMGGGPIGCELAQAFQRLGSQVVLVEREARILGKDHPDAGLLVRAQLEADGVRVLTGHLAIEASRSADGTCLRLRDGDGRELEVTGDELLVAAGRRVALESLDLAAAGIATGERGLEVDARLRTSNRRVFVAGDAAGGFQFTHAADAHARLVLRNALFYGRGKVEDLVVPWATYTEPEVAHVGCTHEEAEREGLQRFRVDLEAVDRARLEGERGGFAEIYVDARGRIRGATVVSARAGDLIGEAALAITAGLRAGQLSQTIHPYPTQAEVWRKLGDAHERTRLRPWVARAFERWFALSR